MIARTLNRTSVELKLFGDCVKNSQFSPLNRTSVELKYAELGLLTATEEPLIVPQWN